MRAAAPLALAALAALAASCDRPPRPDVLIVTIDTLRADHVGAYGHDRDTTPHLDRLAAEGVLFETAYAPVGSTTPSHASLFTGRHPLAHGVTSNGMRLPESAHSIAEEARRRGWTTAAFISSVMASSRWGLAQGFAHVDERVDQASSSGGPAVYRSPTDVVDAALDWLAAQPAGGPPVFAWLHLFDPHSPWDPPPEHRALFPPRRAGPRAQRLAAYEAEVHYSDAELGRFLAAFDARPGEPLVVVTSDHGEGLWDHGWPLHSRTTYEEELRVPLLLRWREQLPAGRRLPRPHAALRDLPATLAGLLGWDAGAWSEGMDHSRLLRGETGGAAPRERELLVMRPLHPGGREPADRPGPGLGLRTGRWKSFAAPLEERLELYDLQEDPRERKNLAEDRSAEAEGLARRSLELARAERGRSDDTAGSELTDEELEALRSLGYLQ